MNHPHGAWIHMEDAFRGISKEMFKGSGLLGQSPEDGAFGPHEAFPRDKRTNQMVEASQELDKFENDKYDAKQEGKDASEVPVEPKLGNIEPGMFGNPNLGGQFK